MLIHWNLGKINIGKKFSKITFLIHHLNYRTHIPEIIVRLVQYSETEKLVVNRHPILCQKKKNQVQKPKQASHN